MIRPASSASEHAVTFGQQGDGAAAAGARVRAFQAVAALVVAVLLGIGGTAEAQGAPKKVDLAKGQQIASQACAACHGADGNATGPANPKLAGQRVNAIMMGFASTLSDDDKRNVAAYYASQVKKPSSAKDKALVELGQQIYRGGIPGKQVPSCAGCHGPAGAGMPAQYPRIAGQWAEYTESQLVQFRGGQRMNSAQMTAISARLSDREIKAVADYVAGLR